MAADSTSNAYGALVTGVSPGGTDERAARMTPGHWMGVN